MGWTNGEQWRQLFLCGGMGFLLGAYYNAFFDRTCRFAVRRFFRDVLFCVSAALLLFLFSLGVTNGRLRAYLLVAVAAGFWVYRRTVGLMIDKLRRRIARCVTVFLRPVTDFYRKCEKSCKTAEKIAKNS